jgi:hypothetical protein
MDLLAADAGDHRVVRRRLGARAEGVEQGDRGRGEEQTTHEEVSGDQAAGIKPRSSGGHKRHAVKAPLAADP